MARLPDEQWDMIKDSIDKKNVARSSHNRRTHCGKGGSVKFPSDFMTKKELRDMNGECKSYRLNEPMSYKEFKQLPNDIKVMYIKALREKYHVPNKVLAESMGASYANFCHSLAYLGLSLGKGSSGVSKKWHETEDADKFYAWWGKQANSEPSIDIPEESTEEKEEAVEVEVEAKVDRKETCVPTAGHLSFNCIADEALDMVKTILTGKHVHMVITWDTEEG